jgi:FkbM family methyltransferase
MLSTLQQKIKIVRSRPNPLKFLIGTLLVRTGLCRLFTINRNGYKVIFFPSSLSRSLWEFGLSERDEDEQIIRTLLRPGDTYVDVGANIGTLAIVAKLHVGVEGHVIAIEAHPRTFSFLKENIKYNHLCLDAYNVAVGEKSGRLTFTDTRADDMNSPAIDAEKGLVVDVTTLDQLLAGVVQDIRLLKVDVEGFELPVFRGASTVLDCTQLIYFESWDRHFKRYGYETYDLIDFLNKAGFIVFRNSRIGIETITTQKSTVCENLIAVSTRCVDKESISKSFLRDQMCRIQNST